MSNFFERVFGWHPWRSPSKKGTIEIAVWHRAGDKNYNAARVIRKYAKMAVEKAWGDEYDVKAWVSKEKLPPREEMGRSEAFGYVRDNTKKGFPYKAKDANLICLGAGTNGVGGGSVCKFSVETPTDSNPDVADLWTTPNTDEGVLEPEPYQSGPPYGKVDTAIHELGHCLGFGHDTGGYMNSNTGRYASAMPYIDDSEKYALLYHPETIEREPEVQDGN